MSPVKIWQLWREARDAQRSAAERIDRATTRCQAIGRALPRVTPPPLGIVVVPSPPLFFSHPT